MSDRLRSARLGTRRRERRHGQALVEFSIAVIPFLLLLMGVLDLGRAIYALNATSEAAREIARATSVHRCASTPCTDLGTSTETQDRIDTHRGLIPGFTIDPSTDIDCVDETDLPVVDPECKPSSSRSLYIRVHVRSTFTPITPLVAMFGDQTVEAWSRIELP